MPKFEIVVPSFGRPISATHKRYISAMTSARSDFESADIMSDGLLITFDDGRCAIYPAELLLSIFSQAREIEAYDDDDALPS